MIQIPDELSRDNFKGLFVRGGLFHCRNFNFADGTTRDKFILVLNGCNPSGRSYFFLPTSKVDKYEGNMLYQDGLFVFSGDSVSTFSEKTAVVIRNVHSKNHTYFEQKYLKKSGPDGLDFREAIDDAVMDEIDRMIMASTDIELRIKKEVLPPKYVAS